MASKSDIEAYYDTFGALHLLRMRRVQGAYPDFTCAYFNGNYAKPYAQAQADKYAWVFGGLGFENDLSGIRVLDVGCGWGPMLNAVRNRNGNAVGLTLSGHQARHGVSHGLDVRLRDYKSQGPAELGAFNGVVSLGAFEHFCSIEEMLEGRQESIYRDFFARCAAWLPQGGRLYLQTMTWGGRVPDHRKLSLDAPVDSPEAILARMKYMYPGSWLPDGLSQIVESASAHFKLVERNNGRLDYLETLRHWGAATRDLWRPATLVRTIQHVVPLGVHLLTDRSMRVRWQAIRRRDQEACFRRGIMDHERLFFEKK